MILFWIWAKIRVTYSGTEWKPTSLTTISESITDYFINQIELIENYPFNQFFRFDSVLAQPQLGDDNKIVFFKKTKKDNYNPTCPFACELFCCKVLHLSFSACLKDIETSELGVKLQRKIKRVGQHCNCPYVGVSSENIHMTG